ncbi:hypothetical protein GCM10023340_08410 [Nocardioides marinquilinus]|uniref:Terminase n=1 Tax=Nocardioides marinquilinus TaxID=1210400 RepID=A0ABP9PA52_9ACTN
MRDTCHRLGWTFDGWQDGAGRLILAKGADGLYAADIVVVSIPRQVGKTYLVAAIIFALGILEPGLTVIWTAHRKSTAVETFAKFYDLAQRPKVKPHVRQVLRGKGEEQIRFTNGSRILFGARESGFGRGFEDVDILVFDEGQILGEATLDDMAAAQNVAANPLTFVIGTPPRPKDQGEFFTLLRQEALDGDDDGTLYIEFSADRFASPMDRDQWRKANPSYPLRTTERAMLRLRKLLKSEPSWRREALGIWDEQAVHRPVVSPTRWAELADPGPEDGTKPTALGLDMSHAGTISVTACWLDDETAHVEEVWAGTDAAAAHTWIVERAGRRTPVLVDTYSPAAQLEPALKASGVSVRTTSATQMARACGLVYSDVSATPPRLTHGGQPAVDDAIAGAKRRPIGSAGGWGWDRTRPEVDIAPIVSLSLARFGAEQKRRRSRGGENTRTAGSGRHSRGRTARASGRRAVVR